MGWRDRIVLESSSIKLAMEKDFESLDSHEFAERAWDRLCSPDHHPRLFSHGLTVKVSRRRPFAIAKYAVHTDAWLSRGMSRCRCCSESTWTRW